MRNHVIALLLILFFANTGFAQQAIVSREKPLNFSRKDCINLSIYDWPRTLLSYPIYCRYKLLRRATKRRGIQLYIVSSEKQCLPAKFTCYTSETGVNLADQ